MTDRCWKSSIRPDVWTCSNSWCIWYRIFGLARSARSSNIPSYADVCKLCYVLWLAFTIVIIQSPHQKKTFDYIRGYGPFSMTRCVISHQIWWDMILIWILHDFTDLLRYSTWVRTIKGSVSIAKNVFRSTNNIADESAEQEETK